jgi:hypothetical protein
VGAFIVGGVLGIALRLGLATAVLWGVMGSSSAQSGLRNTPMGFCALSSVSSATKITTANCVFGSFTGVLSGTTLTVTAVTGSLLVGQIVVGSGVAANTVITGQTSGTVSGAGIYTVSASQTVTSESMTTAGVPALATYAVVCAYTQAVNWRDDKVAPGATVGTGGQGIPAGQCMPYNGTLTELQFIQQTATAVLAISFYGG